MDSARKDRHLDRAYGVRTSTFRQARAVYHNVYHIRAARSAVYYIHTARSAAAYHIRTARSAVYYNIYYICATAATSSYLTSPIYS